MFPSLALMICVVISAKATKLSQEINPLHLHAKYPGFPETFPEEPILLERLDKHVSYIVEKFAKERFPKPYTFTKSMYGPIKDVHIPGVKFPLPINLTNIEITGLKKIRLNNLKCQLAKNRVDFEVTIPSLLIDVTLNILLQLDGNFNNDVFYTNIGLNIRLLDVAISGAFRYNVGDGPNEPEFFIDKADIDIEARESLFEIDVKNGLEELRYQLSELLNWPANLVMDALFKIVVHEINQELLAEVNPTDIIEYLTARVPGNANQAKDLITINHL